MLVLSRRVNEAIVIGDGIEILREQGHMRRRLDPHCAVVGCGQPRHQSQQGRLALAVAPDQTDALALIDEQRNPIEQRTRTERQRDVVETQQHPRLLQGFCSATPLLRIQSQARAKAGIASSAR